MKFVPLASALLACLAFTAAEAQVRDPVQRRVQPPQTTGSLRSPGVAPDPFGRAAAPVCVPWCPYDDNPCDPPAFKIADGRCSFNDR